MTPLPSHETREWRVTGMDCGSCAGKVRGAVERLPGVEGVEISLMSERLRLALAPDAAPQAIEAAVRALGFGITPLRPAEVATGTGGGCTCTGGCCDGQGDAAAAGHPPLRIPGLPAGTVAPRPDPGGQPDARPGRGPRWHATGKGRFVIGTGLLLAASWAVALASPDLPSGLIFAAACLIGLFPVARRALALLRAGMPFTIEMLMTIAATGALAIGAAEEAAMVVFLFAVGELLEAIAADRARDGIRALAGLIPRSALVETTDGRLQEVAAEALFPGQRILVRPGDRIPADGIVAEGMSDIDESPVTGESLPVARGPGEAVRAGSINIDAALRISVTRAGADSTIARIVRLVEEAESARAPTERFIDRFSRIYMPAIVGIAVLVAAVPPMAFGQDWGVFLYRALALLLIGCPCALVISVPAAIASALSAGARRGLLMKGGAVIETLADVRRVAFDKTGTLTLGRPEVTDIHSFGSAAADEVLALAAAAEAGSAHPLGRAIVERADRQGIAIPAAASARALPGRGVEALVGSVRIWVGAPPHADGAASPDRLAAAAFEAEGKTTVLVLRDGEALGLIALADTVRGEAAEALRHLSELGLRSVMLTGDNPRAAAAVAGRLGIDFRASLLPEDKLAVVGDLARDGGVAMIGDGINDAPALKRASVGIAMGAGSDVALETADAALLRNRLTDLPAMIRLSRAAMHTIRQNIALALGLKGLFLVTSVLGITGLWPAILADTGATVLVTANALRLLAHDPHRPDRKAGKSRGADRAARPADARQA